LESEPPNPELFIIQLGFVLLQNWGLFSGVFILLILIVCSAMISGSEVAYFSMGPSDVNQLKEEQSIQSDRILDLRSKPRYLLATILISNNFVNIAIVVVSDFLLREVLPEGIFDALANYIHNDLNFNLISEAVISRGFGFLITVALVTAFLVLFGEVAPKIYANLNNLLFARRMSRPLIFLRSLFNPVNSVLVSWSEAIESRVQSSRIRQVTDKVELGQAIEIAVSDEESSEEEVGILKSIVNFSDVPVKQIMKSRVDVIAIDYSSKFSEVLKLIRVSGYSRMPVFQEDFDSITGILYIKDLLAHIDKGDEFEWQELIRTNVLYVHESKKINDLLKEIQQRRLHMAIVVDEYGGSAGIVTLEDIMEEVIGEIKDEFDDDVEVEYLKIDDHNYIFEGKSLINDVCRIIGVETNVFDKIRGESDSLAGLVLEMTGKIPSVDKEISHKNFKFKIISVSNRRIEKINISIH
jgi:gliding motility-associated protein GldE